MNEEIRRKISETMKGSRCVNLGYKHTDKTKIKISEARKGRQPNLGKKLSTTRKRKCSEITKKMMTLSMRKQISEKLKGRGVGRKLAEETKRKLSKANSGENHPNWKGGVSSAPYCAKFNNKFKEQIREKFGRACFLCGEKEKGRKLSVHHVNYDKSCLCSEIECEFVPLCASCHGKTSNGDREHWEEKIINKLGELKMNNKEMV